MPDSRNLIIAIVLSLIVLLGWQYFFVPQHPATVSEPVATAPDEAEDESPRLSAVPEDLPDPFEPHSNAWLLRRLALARRQAGDLRAATDHVLAELDGGPPSRA